MPPSEQPTRDRLIDCADRLFRAKGYHGVGLTEILTAARAPKGSLYYAFPNGKADLALAVADRASAEMLATIAAAFEPCASYAQGLADLCGTLADAFEQSGGASGCPIAATLFDDPANAIFRDHGAAIYGKWQRALAYHAIRLGEEEDRAERQAETFLIALQGAWVLARTRRQSGLLRDLPDRLG